MCVGSGALTTTLVSAKTLILHSHGWCSRVDNSDWKRHSSPNTVSPFPSRCNLSSTKSTTIWMEFFLQVNQQHAPRKGWVKLTERAWRWSRLLRNTAKSPLPRALSRFSLETHPTSSKNHSTTISMTFHGNSSIQSRWHFVSGRDERFQIQQDAHSSTSAYVPFTFCMLKESHTRIRFCDKRNFMISNHSHPETCVPMCN